MNLLKFIYDPNAKPLTFREPRLWVMIALFESVVVAASGLAGQPLGVFAGIIGVVCAIAARWFVTHPSAVSAPAPQDDQDS